MAMADAFLESSLGSGYEDWEASTSTTASGMTNAKTSTTSYKANGFEVVNPGFAVLAEQPKGLAY